MKRKIILKGFLVTILSIFVLSVTAFAQSNSIFASEYISYTNADIAAEENGRFAISYSITGTDVMTQIGATSVVVYENDGTGFSPIKTFRYTDEGYSGMMGKNNISHGAELYYTGTVGYKYYAKVFLKAGNQYGSDTFTEVTSTITAKKR